ncbi:MAG TPA: hypothetical protein VF144_04795 [Chitinophagaceae bacterium]
MKKIAYIFIAAFLPFVVSAQENMFVIYSVKGTVSVVENKVETKARIGTIINSNSSIKLGAGSFATLLCNETKMFSLNKAGSYTTKSLADSCKTNNSSVSANYMKYIWNEMTKSKGTPEKNRKAYMSNVGAVGRGDINNVWVDQRLDSVNYVSGTIPLSWKCFVEEAEEFEFRLYDASKTKVIFSKNVKKKHVDISEISKLLQPGQTYYWNATVKGENENEARHYLHFKTKEEYQRFLNTIKKVEGAEGEAEMNFRLGFVLEENHYLAEAYNHYLKATQLDPTNSFYRNTFMSFKKDFEIK